MGIKLEEQVFFAIHSFDVSSVNHAPHMGQNGVGSVSAGFFCATLQRGQMSQSPFIIQ